jgi:membrane protease YdiL (CAAX protease family)
MVNVGSGRPRHAIPALLALGAAVLGTVSMVLASRLLGFEWHVELRATLLASELCLTLPALAAVLAVVRRPLAEALAIPIRRPVALLAAALGLALWVGSLGLLELQYAVWPPPEGYLEMFRRLHEALRPSGPMDALYSVVAIAVAPAVCEETLNRGIVLPSLLRTLGSAGAVVVSALVFGFMHVDLYRLPFTFVVGLALGVLRLRAGSLSASVIAHATLNTLTFLTAPWLDDPSEPMPSPRPLLGAALFVLGAAGTLAFLALTARASAPPRVVDSPGAQT